MGSSSGRSTLVLTALMALACAGGATPQAAPKTAWGWTSRGIALRVAPLKSEYVVREPVVVGVFIRNTSQKPITLVDTESDLMKCYRIVLFDSEGRAVAKTESANRAEARNVAPGLGEAGPESRLQTDALPPVSGSQSITDVRPGEEPRYPRRTFTLDDWYDLSRPGTYRLVVMRRAGPSWDDGIAVSNMATITIKAP